MKIVKQIIINQSIMKQNDDIMATKFIKMNEKLNDVETAIIIMTIIWLLC